MRGRPCNRRQARFPSLAVAEDWQAIQVNTVGEAEGPGDSPVGVNGCIGLTDHETL